METSLASISGLVMCGLRRVLLGKDFSEKGFDGAPGAGVAGGVVGDAGDIPFVLVGEAVDGLAIDHELPVGVGGFHFVGERGDLSERDVRIKRAVANEDFGFDGVGRGGILRVEAAVDADDAGDGRAAAGEFEDGHAAEAVADRGDTARIGERVRF